MLPPMALLASGLHAWVFSRVTGTRSRDFNRSRLDSAKQGVEVAQPIFAIESDVEIDAIQRAKDADGIRPVFQHAGIPDGGGRFEELAQWAIRKVVVELFVVQPSAG